MSAEEPAKRVFLSYARESDEYCRKVEALATRLRRDGVDAHLDEWDLKGNDDLPAFMTREIREADWVLVLGSPTYASKVHLMESQEHSSGAGWEARLLANRMFADNEDKVFLALLGPKEEAIPDFLKGKRYYDLSAENVFEVNYNDLLRWIAGKSKKAPLLGSLPADLEQPPVEPLRGRSGASASREKE